MNDQTQQPTQPVTTAEIIRCHCGCIFAACVDGFQDDAWNKQKSKYLSAGCTAETIRSNEVRLNSCDCSKEPGRMQLSLF